MRPILFCLTAALTLLIMMGNVLAADDLNCLDAYLSGTPYQPGTSSGFSSLEEAASTLRDAYGAATIPDDWCSFAQSENGLAILHGLRIRRYDLQIGELPEIDDGVSQLAYNFDKVTLATRYDGLACKFDIERDIEGKTNLLGYGTLTVEQGHIRFTEATWLTKGEATSDSFRRSNLAITEKGTIVGRLLVYGMFVPDGAVPKAPTMIRLDGKGQKGLEQSQPVGVVKFPIEWTAEGQLNIVSCLDKDGNPVKRSFDFSKFKIAKGVGSDACSITFERLLHGEGQTVPQRIGSGRAKLVDGRFMFISNFWQTKGPTNSLLTDNIAITSNKELVGVMDVYFVFPTTELPNPEYKTIVLKGGQGGLDDRLKGEVRFPIEPGIDGIVSFACKSSK